MIYWLADHFQSSIPFFRLFEYLTFRAIMSILTALLFSLWLGPRMIARLQMLQIGQIVRNDGPESHFSKRGTPTMGGLMIFGNQPSHLWWLLCFMPTVKTPPRHN